MPLPHRIWNWLSFGKNERKAMLGIFLFIAMAMLFPLLIAHFFPEEALVVEIATLDALQAPNDHQSDTQEKRQTQETRSAELFYFDPNRATLEDWLRLGISRRTAMVILHYREKGGRFHTGQDLLKIYGFQPADYQRLAPYVQIAGDTEKPGYARIPATAELNKSSHADQKQSFLQQKIELNSADTLLFMQLPGVGATYARRIIRYRERLGGFYRVDQLREIPYLPDSIVQRMLPWVSVDTDLVRHIDLNTAQLGELAAHPYIGYALARLMIAYREQHGPYQQVADLQKLVLVDEQIYRKLVHYLVVNPVHHATRSQ